MGNPSLRLAEVQRGPPSDLARRFNTKPRELSHAQDRLTKAWPVVCAKCSLAASSGLESSPVWVRLILTTLGPGETVSGVLTKSYRSCIASHQEMKRPFMEELAPEAPQ